MKSERGCAVAKGDDYAKAMEDTLKLMYERGAIGGKQVFSLQDIMENVGTEQQVAPHLMNLLKEDGLVSMNWFIRVYRLTGPGFAEARRLVEMDRRPVGLA